MPLNDRGISDYKPLWLNSLEDEDLELSIVVDGQRSEADLQQVVYLNLKSTCTPGISRSVPHFPRFRAHGDSSNMCLHILDFILKAQ